MYVHLFHDSYYRYGFKFVYKAHNLLVLKSVREHFAFC